jgi:hypothetical protein
LTNETSTDRSAGTSAHEPAPGPAAPGVHPQRLPGMDQRVLLIAFHFPPEAVSSGIQRTLSFF